jgi:hypothetical protein
MELTRKTKLTIYIILGLLLISIIIFYVYTKSDPSGNNQPAPSQPSFPVTTNFPIPSPDEDEMPIHTAQGTVEINNLYKNPDKTLSQNGVGFIRNPDYYMSYYPEDQGFIITILNPNIEQGRIDAEKSFLQFIGITENQACLLKVTLNVPFAVNAEVSGPNYGLSFCPNGKPFPKK